MAETLTTFSVEGASGSIGSMLVHQDASSRISPIVHVEPSEIGGCSTHYLAVAAGTNATVIKTAAGVLYGVTLFHINDAPLYVPFYDTATTPSVNVTTIKLALGFQAAATAALGYSASYTFPSGLGFSTGLAFSVHKGIPGSGSSCDANEAWLVVSYK